MERSKSVVPEAWGTPGFGRVLPVGGHVPLIQRLAGRIAGRGWNDASFPPVS